MLSHRIALASFGSFGDLHPYLSIAGELKRRGHHPIIATIAMYRDKVEAAGFEFRLLRTALVDRPDAELMQQVLDLRNGAEFIVRKLMMPALPVAYADAREAFAGVSLVVVHPMVYGARLAAEAMQIPWVFTQLAPMGFFSAYDPPALPVAPWLAHLRSLGPAFFRPFLSLAKRSVRDWSDPYHKLRSELGLPPAGDPMFDGAYSKGLVLALFSKILGDKMPDWPEQTVTTGFPFYDGEDTCLCRELGDFLDAGDPPIVFTLGTSAVLDAGGFYQQSAEAAQALGKRAILLVGSEPANIPTNLPSTILPIAYAPFSLLFPRATAIVHQGGVGTTGQAMRSGKPMLVMPYAVDQPDNAERVRRLGIARVLARRAFSSAAAARELYILLQDGRYRKASAEIAGKIALEDGAGTACDHLLRYLEQI
jgi:UDP:flavonoid glycosyltransferase YjiC (YdhE family)